MGKRHTIVKVPWPIYYSVIDKDTHLMVSPTHVQSMVSSIDVNNNTNQSEIAAHWLPTTLTLTITDHNQPKPLTKLPVCIRRYSLQYHTSVLIESASTLDFVSQNFMTRNNLMGKCTRGPNNVARIANEQRVSTSKKFHP